MPGLGSTLQVLTSSLDCFNACCSSKPLIHTVFCMAKDDQCYPLFSSAPPERSLTA
ncbi:hypothetical protein ACRRTK_015277 [Alexandromys fortis]